VFGYDFRVRYLRLQLGRLLQLDIPQEFVSRFPLLLVDYVLPFLSHKFSVPPTRPLVNKLSSKIQLALVLSSVVNIAAVG